MTATDSGDGCRVFVDDRAEADLAEDVQERVERKVDDVVDFPGHFLKPLKHQGGYVLRVGPYRVRVAWDRKRDILVVEAVGHWKTFYEELDRRS